MDPKRKEEKKEHQWAVGQFQETLYRYNWSFWKGGKEKTYLKK